jgi:endoglucanase
MKISRRIRRWPAAIILCWLTVLGWADASAAALPAADWQGYRQVFVQDGRIVDTGNGGISHSEGQGFGMLLAIAADDRTGFEQIWTWTRGHLRREDGLFAWHWDPNQQPPVKDWNNAADGDLLIAWALARAGEKWQNPTWTDEARHIAQRLRTANVYQTPFGPALLPGQYGFQKDGVISLNPSYWVFPAFEVLARIDPDPIWPALTQSGLALLRLSRYGPYQIPPDWIVLYPEGRLGLSPDPSRRRFGFEAIRIPLYLCWAGLKDPILMQGLSQAWADEGTPAWVDLANGDRAAYPLTLAQRAIRLLVEQCQQRTRSIAWKAEPRDYYGSTLLLFVKLILNNQGKMS